MNTQFVPKHEPVQAEDIQKLEDFLRDKPQILVLTGAGISTESGTYSVLFNFHSFYNNLSIAGIPDYRSEGVGLYARSNARPTQHLEFMRSPKMRQRYWARNFVAWPKFSNIKPNATHLALARFERNNLIGGLVTQNVDRLHGKAGSKNVLELHGCGYTVKCMGSHCKYSIDRHDLQHIFSALNYNLVDPSDLMRPDGDIELPQVNKNKFLLRTTQSNSFFFSLLGRNTWNRSKYLIALNAAAS